MDLILVFQIKTENVLLTMILKTHFTQNITCSLFCESASFTLREGVHQNTFSLLNMLDTSYLVSRTLGLSKR